MKIERALKVANEMLSRDWKNIFEDLKEKYDEIKAELERYKYNFFFVSSFKESYNTQQQENERSLVFL